MSRKTASIWFMAIVIVPSMILNGWAFAKLWAWFIVPPFGLPALTFAQAVGVAFFLGYVRSRMPDDKDDDHEQARLNVQRCLFALLNPLFAVAFGFVVRAFIY